MALYESLRIKPKQRKFEVYQSEDDGVSVAGIYIRKPPAKNPSKPHLHLQKATGSDERQAWAGYFASAEDEITRAVYFYCEKAAKRDALLQKVQAKFPRARSEPDGHLHCVVLESILGEKVNDLDWFRLVFEAAGVGGMA